MRYSVPGLFVLSALLACPPAHAQFQALKRLPAVCSTNITRAANRSFWNNGRLRDFQRVSSLLKTNATPTNFSFLTNIPPSIRQSVFTIQASEISKHKGSAFAVNIGGRVWGVTARHVMDDIGHTPYMTIPGQNGEPVTLLAKPSAEGSTVGADLALFEIPEEALEFIQPLELAEEIPPVYETLSSSGFAHGNFLSQPNREVLFSSRYRILTKYVPFNG